MAFIPKVFGVSFFATQQIKPKENNIDPTVLAISKPSASNSTPINGKMNFGNSSIPIPNGTNMMALMVKKVESFIGIELVV